MNKKMTIMQFLAICICVVFVIVLAGTLLFVHYMTQSAIRDAARIALGQEARYAARSLEVEEGNYHLQINHELRLEDCELVLISEEDGYLTGTYPDQWIGVVNRPVVKNNRFWEYQDGTGKYYVYDKHVRQNNVDDAERLYIRAMVNAKDMDTVYQTLEKFYYVFVIFLILFLVVVGIVLYRRAGLPLREMCEKSLRIGDSKAYSERIEESGFFYETRVMSRAYNALLDRTERLLLQQEEFNENVSHELRTPVTLIRSECELVEDLYQEALTDEVRESVAVIHQQGDRMNAMITDLMYLARIDRDGYEMHLESIDLVDVVESACEDIEDIVQAERQFIYDLRETPVNVDISLISIVVRNLLSNAVKYSSKGSRIWVETRRMDATCYLKVRDEGIGIPREEQDKIFDYYYRVEDSRSSEGFGLGLTLALRIASRHNGRILLSSEPSQGSEFVLELPVAREKVS